MRHGESEFNNANVFTGWCDVALTPRGVVEAIEAGQVFRSHELTFRKCYASLLTRSIVTAYRSLETAGIAYTPLEYDWRWNERHYGALQGLSKERTAVRLGQEKVMKWRRSYDACPPLMTPEHPHYDAINNDPRYRHLDHPPLGESLQDCQIRVVEAWKDICRDLATTTTTAQDEDEDEDSEQQQSEYSLLVAHANTLRALVMYLDDIGVHEIEGLNIPTAIPFYYDIDKTTGQVVSSHNVDYLNNVNKIAAGKFRGIYISDERKKRSFLERRRAANDPWMWALHDHQVKASMLEGNTGIVDEPNNGEATSKEDDLEALKEEARKNTELFAPGSGWHG
jgi:2,3-bisphosphoglycerate-dependent phosphoglycerate mutase